MIPDFTKMTEEELMQFWHRYTRATRKDAEELIGDRRKGYTNAAAAIANYACNKAVQMGCVRRDGPDAASVDNYGHAMDLSYVRIPADLRPRGHVTQEDIRKMRGR